MYSFRMSFWMVPPMFCQLMPCFLATEMYIASSMEAGALMVMLVVTLSRGIPEKRTSMS